MKISAIHLKEKEREINRSQETSEYRIAFLGVSAGAAMSGRGISDETANSEKTYAAIGALNIYIPTENGNRTADGTVYRQEL